ncbi:MAG: glycosyltransferase [Patescibacteria group bacterium]
MAELAQSFSDAGNDVWVLTPYTPLFKITKKDYKVVIYKYIYPNFLHKLGYSETLNNDMGLSLIMWFLSPFMYLFGTIALIRLIKKEKIEIINAHWILPNGFIASVASLITGTPVVSTLPGSDVYMARKNILFNWLAKFAAWKSNWITSNSGQLLSDFGSITNVELKSKMSIIVYGIGSSKFKSDKSLGTITKKSLGISANTVVVLGVGRLVAKKGFRYLIQASKEILKKYKAVKFILIGDGEERKSLERLMSDLGVSENYIFLGSVSYTKMNSYYNMSDIFVLPSVRDEKGNLDDQSVAVMDAMACGKPVVTTDFAGYRAVVEHGKNGYLVAEKDYKGITKSLLKLIESKKLRLSMGENNKNKIANMFSWKKIGQQYKSLFLNIIKNPFYSQSLPSILNKKERMKKAKQIYNVLKFHLGETVSLKCLDVGCSDGTISNYLSGHFKKTVGIDVDSVALSLASESYQGKNLKFIEMPAEKIAFPSNYFDVVIANQIYEFVKDDNKTVSEIYRVLKKGGVCFFGARNKYALVEAQYNLPFLSFLPKKLADLVVKITGKGESFIGNYRSYLGLINLIKGFKIHDYTTKILLNPLKYGYKSLAKFGILGRILPLELFYFLIPNYIWILEKE